MVESVAHHTLASGQHTALAALVRGRLHLTHGIADYSADDSWTYTQQVIDAAVVAGLVSVNSEHPPTRLAWLTSEGRALAVARGWWPDAGNAPEEGPETPQEPSAGEGPGPSAPETSDALEDDRAPLVALKSRARSLQAIDWDNWQATVGALERLCAAVLALPADD